MTAALTIFSTWAIAVCAMILRDLNGEFQLATAKLEKEVGVEYLIYYPKHAFIDWEKSNLDWKTGPTFGLLVMNFGDRQEQIKLFEGRKIPAYGNHPQTLYADLHRIEKYLRSNKFNGVHFIPKKNLWCKDCSCTYWTVQTRPCPCH